jgi:hypothetical protein
MKALLIAGLALAMQITPTMRPGEKTAADIALIVSKLPRFTYERFAALPPSVRDQFRTMNCQVPQPSLTGAPQNVIQGEFAAKGQRDWAALCSNGSTTTVRIVWGGAVRCEDSFAARQDADTVVQPSPGVWNYSRTITTGSVSQINRVLLRSKSQLSESPAHDGIEDTIDRVTLAHYCAGSRWQTVP